MADGGTAGGDADGPGARRRTPLTDGWSRQGPNFTKQVPGDAEASLKLARRLVTKASKAGASLTLTFGADGLEVGLPADGRKFAEAGKALARSLAPGRGPGPDGAGDDAAAGD